MRRMPARHLTKQLTTSFDKGKKVVTFFKSSTIGRNDLGQVQQELYDHKLGMLQQECKTRWSSTHAMGDSLMTVQESVQMYCVKEQMTDGDGNKFNMSFEDWDVIGQGTASLSTIAAVVKQAEGDKYVTSSLVLPFINTCMKSLAGDGSIKDDLLGVSSSTSMDVDPSSVNGETELNAYMRVHQVSNDTDPLMW